MTEAEIEALIASKRKPAIAMLRTAQRTDTGTPGCWFGGAPTLPAEIDWPVYAHDAYYLDKPFEIPMHFLVQINLAYVPRVVGLPQLPRTGTLFVFFEPVVAAWADDMAAMRRGKGSRVIYVPDDVSACAPRTPPPMPDLSVLNEDDISEADYVTKYFSKWPFDFVVVDTYPLSSPDPLINGFPPGLGTQLRRLREDLMVKLDTLLGGDSYLTDYRKSVEVHTIFGATSKRYLPTEDYHRRLYIPTDVHLTGDHIMLLRFLIDEDIGHYSYDQIPWGFWITKEDLDNQNFDNVVVWSDL